MEIPKINNILSSPIQPSHIGETQIQKPVIADKAPRLPDGWLIRERVYRELGIQILDSDVKFIAGEVLVIEETLKEIRRKKKSHLAGVRSIVKNREARVRLIEAALIHAGGAYIPEEKRVYLFDNVTEHDIPEVLIHEIGHAVNHFNLSFQQFMGFVKENHYELLEFRPTFFHQNALYQIGLRRIDIPRDKWDTVWDRFSLKSLAMNRDVGGEMFLENHDKTEMPWDKNPLEKFAWAYEWFVNKYEYFRKLARKAELAGDDSWEKNLEFMRDTVFGD